MAELGMGKWCRFEVLYNGQTYNYDDPNGWETLKTVLSRSENFGINNEVSADELMFPYEIYDIFRQAYKEKGMFAEAKINVYVLDDVWQEKLYGTYDVDFSTYRDDGNYVAVSLIANTVSARLNANFDTEYEIPLDNESLMSLKYEPTKVMARNELAFQAGSVLYHSKFLYLIKGARSTRSYDAELTFYREGTDAEEYGYMEARALSDISSMEVEVGLKLMVLFPFGTGSLTSIQVYSYNQNKTSMTLLYSFSPTINLENKIYMFDYPATKFTVSLGTGKHIGLFVHSYGGTPQVTLLNNNSAGTYMAFNKYTMPGQNNKKLSAFTFDWLFSELLKKIDSNAVFVNNVTNPNITHLLSSSGCMRMIGGEAVGSVKTSFKDVLQAFHTIECVGLDINGNTVTINPLKNHYKNEKSAEVTCSDLVLEHDSGHVYNTIKVGSSGNSDKGSISYNTEKIFGVQDARPFVESDNELDLVCPFITDPFSIQKKIEEYVKEPKKDDEAESTKEEIVLFACGKSAYQEAVINIYGEGSFTFPPNVRRLYIDKLDQIQGQTLIVSINNSSPSDMENPYSDGVYSQIIPIKGHYTILIEMLCQIDVKPTISFDALGTKSFSKNVIIDTHNSMDTFEYKCELITEADNGLIYVYIDMPTSSSSLNFNIVEYSSKITRRTSRNYTLYKSGQQLLNYKGDIGTAYNLPYSPKRMLLKHLPYISISNWNSGKVLKYVSGDNDSNVSSKLAYETEFIEETADVQTVTPLFLPLKATFNFDGDLNTVEAIKNNKYGYLRTIYEGKEYTFWVDDIGVQVGKQSQQEGVGFLRGYDL